MIGAVLMLGAGLGVAAAETGGTAAPAVQCPLVADRLPPVPPAAREEVTRNLALLNLQTGEANQRLESSRGQGGPNFVTNAILGPLADKRRATIERIALAIGRDGERPTGLESLAQCRVTPGGAAGPLEPTTPVPTAPEPTPEPTGPAPTGTPDVPPIPEASPTPRVSAS
ncbi:hypothetical protein SAMN05444365_104257 [Micromonospora pattaloongensis]|uniref:Uncharacterized protein n=1 Tax=Micromonospora pattaloongensis TaxID=405436 RepID=A0A1H3P037_9ACTN|nr:hypothetical protein SAMN05444365_104257 [Micromonospora pattaloongensis]